jgi:hypothetical protein
MILTALWRNFKTTIAVNCSFLFNNFLMKTIKGGIFIIYLSPLQLSNKTIIRLLRSMPQSKSIMHVHCKNAAPCRLNRLYTSRNPPPKKRVKINVYCAYPAFSNECIPLQTFYLMVMKMRIWKKKKIIE